MLGHIHLVDVSRSNYIMLGLYFVISLTPSFTTTAAADPRFPRGDVNTKGSVNLILGHNLPKTA